MKNKNNQSFLNRRDFLRIAGFTSGVILGSGILPKSDQWAKTLLNNPEPSNSLSRIYNDNDVDEFVGPFPSWINVKTDYGAIGDGIADDTNAIQKALDAVQPENAPKKVIYFPAGTYRITNTLSIIRTTHSESLGIGFLGEHPNTTILRWDGAIGGIMLDFGAWNYRMGRVTFDGANKAGTALQHGFKFSTGNEITDTIFHDLEFGIEGGHMDMVRAAEGIAETVVRRCKFIRCTKAGISIQNWMSFNWWIWYCLFEACDYGVTNIFGAGHFNIYESIFRRSTTCDIKIGNLWNFSIRNNYSSNSQKFLDADINSKDAAHMTLQGNTIIDTIDPNSIFIGHLGPVLLLDNIIKNNGPSPIIRNTDGASGDLVSIGNTYTVANPIQLSGRLLTIDDQVVSPTSINTIEPVLPGTPLNMNRQVFEVPLGSNATFIQSIINEAAKLNGQRPIVHLPSGEYWIDRTLTIPANSDLQLVGDGKTDCTKLRATNLHNTILISLPGPCRATLREFQMFPGTNSGIEINDCDQPGSQINLIGCQVSGMYSAGLHIKQLKNTKVHLYDAGCGGGVSWIKIIGTGMGGQDQGEVVVFNGSSAGNEITFDIRDGAKLLVNDLWYESSINPRFLHFNDSGEFTLHGANIALPANQFIPSIELENFKGNIAFLFFCIWSYNSTPTNFLIRDCDKDANILIMGIQSDSKEDAFKNVPFISPQAKFSFQNNRGYEKNIGTHPFSNQGIEDPSFIKNILLCVRTIRPQLLNRKPNGITDALLYRVQVDGSIICIKINGDVGTSLEAENFTIPIKFELYQNYPNPFNPNTFISYQIPVASKVCLKVFDILGREVRKIVDEDKAPGSYKVEFNGSGLASGVYIYRINIVTNNGSKTFVQEKKMILIK